MIFRSDRLRPGFALPAVLAVTGVVTLVFLVAITALASLMSEATSARARVRFMQRAFSAEALVAYMIATEPTVSQGVGVGAARSPDDMSGEGAASIAGGEVTFVRADGRPYALDMGGPLILQMQDQAGMVNLAYLSDDQHDRFMARIGAKPEFSRVFQARYQDYVDADSLKNLNGAERTDYDGDGPADRRLLRPEEWLSILGARDAVDMKRWRSLRYELAFDQRSASFNANTATAGSLDILFGLNSDQVKALNRAREAAPLSSTMDFIAASGLSSGLDYDRSYTVPSGRFVLRIDDGRSSWTYRARLTLTPSGLEQPLWIDQTEMTEAPRKAVADTSDAVRFPYAPR